MSHKPEIEIVPDPLSLAEHAVERISNLMDETLQGRDRFTFVLAGGSTPRLMYGLLAEKRFDWDRIHFFWGDERCVPPDHTDSNFRMVNIALLSPADIPPANIHRIHGELPAGKAAGNYEKELHRFFGNQTPHFDLVLLGLGDDGHTASLFPRSPIIHEKVHWVAAVDHVLPPPPLVDRVTLTPMVLNEAANIIFLVSGEEKAERLSMVLQGPFQPDMFPAQVISPVNGHLCWLVDRHAAAKLIPS